MRPTRLEDEEYAQNLAEFRRYGMHVVSPSQAGMACRPQPRRVRMTPARRLRKETKP